MNLSDVNDMIIKTKHARTCMYEWRTYLGWPRIIDAYAALSDVIESLEKHQSQLENRRDRRKHANRTNTTEAEFEAESQSEVVTE